MFWYLSFLRPPPISVLPGHDVTSITITPQVANDLRTEFRDEPTPIDYVWQRTYPSQLATTIPQRLTEYRPPASTYKPISINLPKSARSGEKWRLGLLVSPDSEASPCASSSSYSTNRLLDLVEDVPEVIGVWSEGIEILRNPAGGNVGVTRGVGSDGNGRRVKDVEADRKEKVKGKGKRKEMDDIPKQGRITREWEIPGGVLKVVEQTSFDLDKKIWDSGLALSAWLWQHLSAASITPQDPLLNEVLGIVREPANPSLRLLELGSGTGLVSISLAQILRLAVRSSLRSTSEIEITATDLESAIKLMNENLSLNNVEHIGVRLDDDVVEKDGMDDIPLITTRARVLDWDQSLPSWITADTYPDLIIAADVTYNTTSFPALVKTLDSLLHPLESTIRPPLLLAYKQRDEGERALWDMLGEVGVKMRKVDEVKGSEEDGVVEIWMGKFGPSA